MALTPVDRLGLAAAMTVAPAWLRARRNVYRRSAHPLHAHELAAFEGFFPCETLALVRVARVEQFRPWPFETVLARVGFRGLLASRSIAGIALIDTVVLVLPAIHGRRLSALTLLFHELVHIEQCRQLGVRGFLREYMGGWLAAGRSYIDIPLEEQAYRLSDRFNDQPSTAFSVTDAVRAEFGASG